MKLLLSLLTLIALASCQTYTDPITGKISHRLTPSAQSQLEAAAQIAASVAASALINGGVSAANQYLATGTLDERQLASAAIYGVAATAQGYIGRQMPSSVVVASTGVPQVGQALAPVMAAPQYITQEHVDSLQAAAAQLVRQ